MTTDDMPAPGIRPSQGRPRTDPDKARSNRVVTFVTDRELQQLQQLALAEDRSLSAVVQRIIAAHFEED